MRGRCGNINCRKCYPHISPNAMTVRNCKLKNCAGCTAEDRERLKELRKKMGPMSFRRAVQQGAQAEKNVSDALAKLRTKFALFHYKIPDTRTLRFGNKNAKNFAKKVPGDFQVLLEGRGMLIEVKSTRNDRFPFRNIEPHQISLGEAYEKAGGISLFAIKHVIPWKNRWIVFTLTEIKALKARQKTIKFEDIERDMNDSIHDILEQKFRTIVDSAT